MNMVEGMLHFVLFCYVLIQKFWNIPSLEHKQLETFLFERTLPRHTNLHKFAMKFESRSIKEHRFIELLVSDRSFEKDLNVRLFVVEATTSSFSYFLQATISMCKTDVSKVFDHGALWRWLILSASTYPASILLRDWTHFIGISGDAQLHAEISPLMVLEW